jgi:hypothetical protein
VLTREISHHSPLDYFGLQQQTVEKPFKFELCWFLMEDLGVVVSKVWNLDYKGKDLATRWQARYKKLRKTAKGWNLNSVWFI